MTGQSVVISAISNSVDREWFVVGAAVGVNLVLSAETQVSRDLAKTFSDGEELLIGYADESGFFTASAVVDRYDPFRRMLRMSNPGRLMLSHRRWTERVKVTLPVEWSWAGAATPGIESGTTIDISARGLAMHSAAAVPAGEEVAVVIHLPRHTLLGVGSVISCDQSDNVVRLRLDQLAANDRTNLTMYIGRIRSANKERRTTR